MHIFSVHLQQWIVTTLVKFGAAVLLLRAQTSRVCIRTSVDALCKDETSQISRDPRTKRLLTRRESLAKPSKHASNSAFTHL